MLGQPGFTAYAGLRRGRFDVQDHGIEDLGRRDLGRRDLGRRDFGRRPVPEFRTVLERCADWAVTGAFPG